MNAGQCEEVVTDLNSATRFSSLTVTGGGLFANSTGCGTACFLCLPIYPSQADSHDPSIKAGPDRLRVWSSRMTEPLYSQV
jgi:hypothetical protein